MSRHWHKYKAKKTTVDGIVFASGKEADRYKDLKLLIGFGDITDLELQPVFVLSVNGLKICKYIADFRYKEKGKIIIEDVKGFQTPVYKLKKKLMKAIFEIEIRET